MPSRQGKDRLHRSLQHRLTGAPGDGRGGGRAVGSGMGCWDPINVSDKIEVPTAPATGRGYRETCTAKHNQGLGV